MSVPSYLSRVAKLLIQSDYVNPRQMQQAIAKFQESGRSIAQGGLSLIEVLESITKQPLPEHLQHHLLRNFSDSSSSFAEKLIESGYVDHDQMQQALAQTYQSDRLLTEILEGITGRQFPPELLHQSKKQQLFELKILYGLEPLAVEKIDSITLNQIAELIDTLIPLDICSRYRLLPVTKTQTQPLSVLVAMVDPNNLAALDDVNRILRPQGIALQRMVITQQDYQQLIDWYRDEELEQQKQEDYQKSVDVSSMDLERVELGDTPDEVEDISNTSDANVDPVIALVNRIFAKALKEGVSDIHIEPQADALYVRFRKDGVLRPAFDESFPKKITSVVAARVKIMAGLDITKRRLPQDGKIRRMFQGRQVDFRVSTLPSRNGETIVLRILNNQSTQLGLDELITNQDTLALVKEMVSRPFGLIVVVGPADSGKSTTLYSILAERNDPEVKICTAEDPIKYSLPGIMQVQVLREKGMDFTSVLQSFLLQDADVILVGEIRDRETAKTVTEAALTGHLVLTSLCNDDTVSAIASLNRMGESFMIADALIGVIAQRLIRRVCLDCCIPYHPSPSELARYGWSTSSEGKITLHRANTLGLEEIREARANDTLCPTCNGIGYKGRIGVYEVMQVSDRIQTLINESASIEQLKEVAVDEGMTTLLAYSLNLVQQGHTTLDEVERVTFTDSGLELQLKAKRKSSPIRHSSPDANVEVKPTDSLQRIQELERQLEALTHQFQQLKKELEN